MIVVEDYSAGDLSSISKQLLRAYSGINVWCFYAEMGSGKTTLIKALCDELGVVDDMSSPTFSIVNEYKTADQDEIYHFDFYRLSEPKEAFDIGLEEYFYSGNLCFCEWPALIEGFLPEDYVKITINLVGNNQRTLTARPNE